MVHTLDNLMYTMLILKFTDNVKVVTNNSIELEENRVRVNPNIFQLNFPSDTQSSKIQNGSVLTKCVMLQTAVIEWL